MTGLRRLCLWLAAIALAASPAAAAQVARPGAAPGLRIGLAPTIYDTDAIAYVAAMSVQPDANRKLSYASEIRCLKGKNPQLANVWSSIAWISILASHDAQAARINAKNPAQVAVANGSPTFAVDRGYTGVPASSAYLEAGVADNTTAQDSLTIYVYVNQAPTVTGVMLGLTTGSGTRITGMTGAAIARVHGSTILTSLTGNSTGFIAYAHTAANANALYRAGAPDVSDATSASTAPTADTFRFLAGSTYSDARLAVAGWGSGMTATQIAAFNFCLAAYLTPIGAG